MDDSKKLADFSSEIETILAAFLSAVAEIFLFSGGFNI